MDPRTGEIRDFEKNEDIPDEWELIPSVGTEIEFLFKQKLKGGINTTRRRKAKVIEIITGTPGRLLVEMVPNKGSKNL